MIRCALIAFSYLRIAFASGATATSSFTLIEPSTAPITDSVLTILSLGSTLGTFSSEKADEAISVQETTSQLVPMTSSVIILSVSTKAQASSLLPDNGDSMGSIVVSDKPTSDHVEPEITATTVKAMTDSGVTLSLISFATSTIKPPPLFSSLVTSPLSVMKETEMITDTEPLVTAEFHSFVMASTRTVAPTPPGSTQPLLPVSVPPVDQTRNITATTLQQEINVNVTISLLATTNITDILISHKPSAATCIHKLKRVQLTVLFSILLKSQFFSPQ